MALLSLCLKCQKIPVTWPLVCSACGGEEDADLAAQIMEKGENPEEWKCRTCGMVWDPNYSPIATKCKWCGDPDPLRYQEGVM